MSASGVRIVRAAEGRRTSWKNGGGETVEIAAHPPGAGLEDFVWRLSTARLAADGPFSIFAGVDRSLALLGGEGFDLQVGAVPTRLRPGGDPASFPGDTPCAARLVAGPVTVLNVMTCRGRAAHRLAEARIDGPSLLPATAGTMLVFCAVGTAWFDTDVRLEAGDTACLVESRDRVSIAGHATLHLIQLDVRGSGRA